MKRNIWAVGDLQGCCDALDKLLSHPKIEKDKSCAFWFAGDLVNRGPSSLKTVKRLMELDRENRAVCILGNHDLHLLAVYAGVRRRNKSDTFNDILECKEVESIINWLRHRPLAHFEYDHLMVHAGVLKKWDTKKTLKLAAEVEQALRSDDWMKYLQKMYGNEPNRWQKGLKGDKRLRVIINALTRMRMCTAEGHMDFSAKDSPDEHNQLIPWFDVPDRETKDTPIIFGHWSTLGLYIRKNLLALDTGCVWGGKLSALRLQDRELVQINCKPHKH